MSAPESANRIYWTNVILIGNIVRHSGFKLAGVDELFVTHGADRAWWTKANVPIHDSRHIDRVNGWLTGINKFAPEKTLPIMRAVLAELLLSSSTISADDRRLAATQVQRIDAFLKPRDATQQQPQLDPRVIAAAGTYWASGHYTKAVQNAFTALITAVQVKAERPDLDTDALMRQVFSVDRPTLKLSEQKGEQRGYMDLFAGSVGAIRNPTSHTANEILTIEEASELLSLASFLFRSLDKSQKIS